MTWLALRLPHVCDAAQSCHALLEHDGIDHVIESGVSSPERLKAGRPIAAAIEISSELGYQHDSLTE
jgi:hypothetical protein